MKICWDNLEKLIYNSEKECWYDKKHNIFHIHICNNRVTGTKKAQ